jgi:hypothetical protein
VINVGWTIETPKPELNFNRNYGLNFGEKILYGAGTSGCPDPIKKLYPYAGCLSSRAFGGVVGAQGNIKVILNLKFVDGRPDMNDPNTVQQDFLVMMTLPRPKLEIGRPRVVDHR